MLVLSFVFYIKRFRLNTFSNDNKNTQLMIDMILVIVGISISQATITIIMSGDAELIQHAFVFGAGMDIISYFIITEIIGKLNILQDKEEESIGTESVK